MGAGEINWRHQDDLGGAGKYFWPSVDCGILDCSKAKSQLNFMPTPIDQAIKESVEFFMNANSYPKELAIAQRKVAKVAKYYE